MKTQRHSFMVSSVPTILRPRGQTSSTPLKLFSIYVVEIQTVFVIGMMKINEKEDRIGSY